MYAAIGGDVPIDDTAQHEQHGRACDRQGTVDVAAGDGVGFAEVELQSCIRNAHRYADRDVFLLDTVALHPVSSSVTPILDSLSHGRDGATFRVVEQITHGSFHICPALPLHQLAVPQSATLARSQLRGEIAPPHDGRAHVGQEQALDIFLDLAGSGPAYRGDDQTLLEDLSRVRRHAARARATHVGVVGTHNRVTGHVALQLHGVHHGYVG